MSKKENENKREVARMLYLGGSEINDIAEKVGVSRQTVSSWINKGGWKEIRAAKNITREELISKLLRSIDTLIEEVNKSGDINAIGNLGDKLSKFSAVIEKLDKKANIVTATEVFMAFSKWVEFRAQSDPKITVQFVQKLNELHSAFLIEKVDTKGGL